MKSLHARTRSVTAFVALLLSSWSIGGCADNRDVLDHKARYACNGPDECLDDFQCVKGWCTPLSALSDAGALVADSDLAKQDSSPTPPDTSPN